MQDVLRPLQKAAGQQIADQTADAGADRSFNGKAQVAVRFTDTQGHQKHLQRWQRQKGFQHGIENKAQLTQTDEHFHVCHPC